MTSKALSIVGAAIFVNTHHGEIIASQVPGLHGTCAKPSKRQHPLPDPGSSGAFKNSIQRTLFLNRFLDRIDFLRNLRGSAHDGLGTWPEWCGDAIPAAVPCGWRRPDDLRCAAASARNETELFPSCAVHLGIRSVRIRPAARPATWDRRPPGTSEISVSVRRQVGVQRPNMDVIAALAMAGGMV